MYWPHVSGIPTPAIRVLDKSYFVNGGSEVLFKIKELKTDFGWSKPKIILDEKKNPYYVYDAESKGPINDWTQTKELGNTIRGPIIHFIGPAQRGFPWTINASASSFYVSRYHQEVLEKRNLKDLDRRHKANLEFSATNICPRELNCGNCMYFV